MKAKNPIQLTDIQEVITSSYFTPIESQLNHQKELIEKTKSIYQEYLDRLQRIESSANKTKFINETTWLKGELYDVLNAEFPEIGELNCEDTFSSFYQKLHEYIEDLPLQITKEQNEERFKVSKVDSFQMSFKKGVKAILFKFSRLPQHFTNLFRKEKKPIHFWKHRIPLRSLCHHFFQNEIMFAGLPFFEELQGIKCDTLNVSWEIDKELNKEFIEFLDEENIERNEFLEHIVELSKSDRASKMLENLDQKYKDWKDQLNQKVGEIYSTYLVAYEKVGTIELSASAFSNNKLVLGEKLANKRFQKIYNGWRNTLFAQIDDFQIDLELYLIKYNALMHYDLTQKSCRSRISSTIDSHLEAIRQELDKVIKPLRDKTKSKELPEKLQAERKRINLKLKQEIIPQSIDKLYNQNLPNLIERLEVRIKKQIALMKTRRIIYAKEYYHAPINKSELNHFNPRELVEIDLFSKFSAAARELKTEVIKQLENVELSLNELIGIVDYNLDAAINSVKEQQSEENIHELAIEGLERTQAKSDDISEKLNEIESLITKNLKAAVDTLNSGLLKLTVNENITDLRLRLAKAKAVEKTEDYKKKILLKIKNSLPILFRYVRQKSTITKTIFRSYAKKLGLIEEPAELSAELSDFLTQTQDAIEQLPYVYKRLYSIKPTEEEVFFVGREHELKKLKNAYENWKKGNYSATAINGEKGSGASSLLNFFLKEIKEEKILRKKLIANYSSEKDFFNLFKDLLKNDKLDTFDQLVEELNNGNYAIIILEDMQHFFMKKIQGFDAINLLFELISRTDDKIFWIQEYTSYAWKYLEKAVNINRFFKFIVQLETFNDKQIIEVIMKRHRVSGYNIKYSESLISKQEKRKFARLNDKEKGLLLEKSYFDSLNRFAHSNISLALLYWLRSTQHVEKNYITIGQLKNVNFDFLSKLPQESSYTLHALLLHDSLSIDEHALLFNQSEIKSRLDLMVLEDQGILNSTKGRYTINRLLFRQIVNVLTNKNIIH